MSFYMSPDTVRRQQPPRTETWQGDAFPFGRPYGALVAPGQERGRETDKAREAGETFEESYPAHPFSELVRLGIAIARLVANARRRTPK